MNGESHVGAVHAGHAAGPRVVDLADAWRDAAADVEEAYHAWSTALPEDRLAGHAVYLAAVDREAAAARYLQGVLQAVRPA